MEMTMEMTRQIFNIFAMLLAAGAIYGGIKADLKSTREKAEAATNRANSAHERISHHVEEFHTRKD